jgi:hypothetical protein
VVPAVSPSRAACDAKALTTPATHCATPPSACNTIQSSVVQEQGSGVGGAGRAAGSWQRNEFNGERSSVRAA